MAEIFLSYRREDSQSATGRLADDLEARFGDERVFRDHEIAAGDDFVAAIRRSVESSTVVLAVVGPRWLDARDAEGRRRLDDRADFVRLEIELALAARVAVVPVLVDGATMPPAAALPPSLAAFTRCQAVELADRRWRHDVETLIASLQSRFGIDAAAAAVTPAGTAPPRVWTGWAGDLADLALHPRRLIARRHSGSSSDHARAFAFLCAAILAGNAMLLTAIDVDLVVRGSGVDVALGIAAWLLTALLAGLIVAGLLFGALALAWRVVARTAVARTVAVVFAYVCGGAWLGWCIGAALAVSAVALIDHGWLGTAFADLQAAVAASKPFVLQPVRALGDGPVRAAASVLLVLAALVWLAAATWCVVAWGAFRRAVAASRATAWLATLLWIAIVAAVVWLPAQIA